MTSWQTPDIPALAAGLYHPERPHINAQELWVVPLPPFAALVLPAIDLIGADGTREYPKIRGRTYLAAVLGVTTRSVNRYFAQQHISLSRADAILIALGLHHHLSDGTLPVIPNPYISRTHWVERATLAGLEEAGAEWEGALAAWPTEYRRARRTPPPPPRIRRPRVTSMSK